MIEDKRAKDTQKAQTWLRYIKAGIRAKRDYTKMAKETLGYFKATHDDLFRQVAARFMDFSRRGVCVSVNKPAQIRSVLGAHLYQKNPHRTVNSKTRDTVAGAMAAVVEEYLNYSTKESGFEEQARRAIDDALLRGRGFLRTGYDAERRCITSWAVSSARVVIDPSAENMEDAHWIAIKTVAPLWAVKRKFGKPEKWRVRDLKANMAPIGDGDDEEDDRRSGDDDEGQGYYSDLVEYWEVYSKMGAGLVRGPEAPEDYRGDDDSRDFVKIVVAPDHEVPLYEGEWECPLYLDKEWPLVKLDLIDCVDELWPQSIFGQALPYAKVIDLTSSLRLEACKNDARRVILLHPEAFEGGEEKQLTMGGPTEVIRLKATPPGLTMEGVYHVMQLGQMSPEVAEERAWAEAEFEKQTGVVSILHGGAEVGAQERSATASNLKSQGANARLNDMLSKVEGFCTRAARNEGILLQLGDYTTPEEVGKAVGDIEIGWLVSVMGEGVEMPLRLRLTKADMDVLAQRNEPHPLSVQEVSQSAAEYFANEEEAAQAAQMVMAGLEQLRMSGDLRVAQYMTPDAMGQSQFSVSVREARVEDVFRDTVGMTPVDVVGEFSFTIEAGTTQRMDPTAKREMAETLMSQVLPKALELGDFQWVNSVLDRVYDAWGLPKAERPPPMVGPPPMLPGPGGPPMAEPGMAEEQMPPEAMQGVA